MFPMIADFNVISGAVNGINDTPIDTTNGLNLKSINIAA